MGEELERRGTEESVVGQFVLSALLILVSLVTLPLGSGLWLDETLTYWIVSGTASDAWRRTIEFQGQSPLYYELVWLLLRIAPSEDVTLRLFSVFCGIGSLLTLSWLLKSMHRGHYTRITVFAIVLASELFQRAYISARPYALALLLAFWSLHLFWLALHSSKRGHFLGWITVSILLIYTHYLFAVVVLFEVAIALIVKKFSKRLLGSFVVIAAALIPALTQLLSLARRAEVLHFAPMPGVRTFLLGVFPISTMVMVLMAVALVAIWGGSPSPKMMSRKLLLVACAWVCMPVVLFALLSVVSGESIFTSRYWCWQVGGFALVGSLLCTALPSLQARRIFVGVLVVVALFRLLVQGWVVEGWREIAMAVAQHNDLPVLLYSGLIEAEDPSFQERIEAKEYLAAPLSRYGVDARRITSVAFPNSALNERISSLPSFILVSAKISRNGAFAPEEFLRVLRELGRNVAAPVEFGTVVMYVVE